MSLLVVRKRTERQAGFEEPAAVVPTVPSSTPERRPTGWVGDAWRGYFGTYGPRKIKSKEERGMVF